MSDEDRPERFGDPQAGLIAEAMTHIPEEVTEAMELALFNSLIGNGINQDAADQASQAAIAALRATSPSDNRKDASHD